MRFLVDMNMSAKWIGALQEAGHQAEHWSSIGAADAVDGSIMSHAAATRAVVLTRDLDFGAILAATGGAGPSVIHLREEDRFQPRVVAWVVEAISRFTRELESGAILTISAGRVRVRRLPIDD